MLTETWLRFGALRPVADWRRFPAPVVTLAGGAAGACAPLALAVASALTSERGVFRCAECGYRYLPGRRRPRGS